MKKYKKMVLLLLILGMSSSCENYLSEVPDDRLQIDSPEKISELLVNAYPPANYMDFAETMTDNAFDSEEVSLTSTENTLNYTWDVNPATNMLDTPNMYWDACFSAIAYANQALEEIKKRGNPASLNPQKGEALLARAYAHFMLVSFWSQRYNPATATKDLGIPYVTQPEDILIKKYTRNSVAEVFDYIQKDLEEGLKYVTDNYKQPKFHFTKVAAKAFASRFYLIKGDWNKVIEYTNDLGNTPSQKHFFNSFAREDNGQQDIEYTAKSYSDANEMKNLLLATVPSGYYRSFSRNRFQLTGKAQHVLFNPENRLIRASIENANNEIQVRYLSWPFIFFSRNVGATISIPKFTEYFKVANANAGTGSAFVTLVLLSNEEVFLNRIEAHVMTNQMNLANQELTLLNKYYSDYIEIETIIPVSEEIVEQKYPVIPNEYTPFYNLTPLQTSYIKAIAEIRRRIFMHEGLRWWDIKRFGLSITHSIYRHPNIVLAKEDKRKALQIPEYATNAGLEKNPR